MKAKKKTVYGSMKNGGRLNVVKPTAAERKKRRSRSELNARVFLQREWML